MARLVRDVMRPNPVCIQGGATLREAATVITDTDAFEVVVIEGDTVIGAVSSMGILSGALSGDIGNADGLVRHFVQMRPAIIGGDLSVEAARLPMQKRKIDRIAVCSKEGIPVGIVTLADLIAEECFTRLTPSGPVYQYEGW